MFTPAWAASMVATTSPHPARSVGSVPAVTRISAAHPALGEVSSSVVSLAPAPNGVLVTLGTPPGAGVTVGEIAEELIVLSAATRGRVKGGEGSNGQAVTGIRCARAVPQGR